MNGVEARLIVFRGSLSTKGMNNQGFADRRDGVGEIDASSIHAGRAPKIEENSGVRVGVISINANLKTMIIENVDGGLKGHAVTLVGEKPQTLKSFKN